MVVHTATAMWFSSWICALFLLPWLTAPLQAYQLNEAPKDMIIGENLYILGSQSLTQLHRNLSFVNSISLLRFDGQAVRMVVDEDLFVVVVCSVSRSGDCRQFDAEGLEDVDASFRIGLSRPEGFVLTKVYSNSVYTAAYSREQESTLLITQHEIDYMLFSNIRSLQLTVTNHSFVSRQFKSAFRFSQFVYFVSMDTVLNAPDMITLMRVCSNEPVPDDESFNYDVYETHLSCGQLPEGANINGVFLLDSTVIIGLSNETYSMHCSFNLSLINTHLDNTFDNCVAGMHSVPLPWAANDQYRCSEFRKNEVSQCNFGSVNTLQKVVPALAASSAVVGNASMELWNYSVTVSLPLMVNNRLLLYLGASNSTGHYLLKYHWSENDGLILVDEYEHLQPAAFLKYAQDYVYVATTDQVVHYVVSDCSKYTTCDSCAADKDPLCGWCVLENKCSSHSTCKSSDLAGRWVQHQSQCILSVTLNEQYVSADGLSSVAFETIPNTSVFPSLSEAESFVCMFTDIRNNTTYNWTVVGSTCVGESFDLANLFYIKLSVAVVQDCGHVTFNTSSLLTVFNCSQHSRCIACQHAPPCGWCVYDQKCTGDSSLCRQSADWRSAKENTHTCPVVLKPPGGRYLQPVGVNRHLNLTTQNIPSPIEGFKYICRVKYLGSQSAMFDVDAEYINDPSSSEQISCLFKRNQTQALPGPLSGVEGAQLSLLYVNLTQNSAQEVEFIRDNSSDFYQFDSVRGPPPPEQPAQDPAPDMLLYNCSQLSNSCSSCVALRLRPEPFLCGWCHRPTLGDICTVSGDCHDPDSNSFFNSHSDGMYCPAPVVRSVSPTSGPIQGGTVISFTGTDLGVGLSSVKSVTLGDHPCHILTDEYLPGRVIKCRTGAAPHIGQVDIRLNIGIYTDIPAFTFSYEHPVISSVVPWYGPSSGGTLVTITGSSLSIGGETGRVVTIAGLQCSIVTLTFTEIECITSPGEVRSGLVQLSVDSAVIVEGSFSYLPDPVVQSVSPANIIESGGVTLVFTGNNLNSTYQPRLVVYDVAGTHEGTCMTVNESTLTCIAPRVEPLFEDVDERSREGPLQRALNYTLYMDSAPGPDINNSQLVLYVRTDPVFTKINESDRVYISGSGKPITILGRDITSVDSTEVTVTVDGLLCDNLALSPNALSCNPPSYLGISSQTTYAEVKVTVAGGTLVYSVGTLEYVQRSRSPSLMTVTEVISISVGTSLAVFIIVISALIFAVICLYTRKRCRVKRARNQEINGSYSGRMNHEERIDDFSHENVYEDVNDIIFNSSGKQGHIGVLKVMEANERYQNSLTRGKRALPEVPNEEYIEMGAHSVWQVEDEAPQARAEVVSGSEDQTIVPNSLLISGEYVDMLPTTTRKGRPNSYIPNPSPLSTGQSESVLPAAVCVCTSEGATEEERDKALSCGTI